MIPEEIYKVAVKVRRAAEKFALKEKFPNHLGGCCFWASRELFKHLKRLNYRVGLAINDGHCFVIYGNYLIDLTATQFGSYPKVYIKPRNNRGVWKECCRTFSLKRAKTFDNCWYLEYK